MIQEQFVRPWRVVIFDFDGTLAVPTLNFTLLKNRAFEALSAFAPVPGEPPLPVMETLERVLAGLAGADAAKARAQTLAAIEEVEMEAAGRSELFDFARPLLRHLRGRGIACAVVTRNFPAAVRTVFPDIDACCDCLVTRHDVARVKPHPEHMGKALRLLGCAGEDCLTVGDHPMDIEAGRRIGASTAAVMSGESSREALAGAGPDFLAEDAGRLMRDLRLWE